MFSPALIERIYAACTSQPKDRALQAVTDMLADLEHTAMLAGQIKVGTKSSGQAIVPSDVTFTPRFEHTSSLNGQKVIAYDILAATLDTEHARDREEENRINKEFARNLNAGMADELRKLNGR